MNDALQTLQALAQRLGRQPTLEELFTHMSGAVSSGTTMPPTPTGPVQARDERADGPLTMQLRAEELFRTSPQLRDARDEILRRLMFGDTAEGMAPQPSGRLVGPGGGHPNAKRGPAMPPYGVGGGGLWL